MKNKMKKFSTIALLLALCSSIGSLAFAAEGEHVHKSKCAFLANAPDQHVVVKGDTLWGISQKFLEHAWCWPRVWGMNRDEIRNPHWIYPGQIVYFDRVNKRLRLGKRLGSSAHGSLPTVHLSPQVRSESLDGNAISTIPNNAIEPFLSQPLVFETDELVDAPHVVAPNRSHVNSSPNEKVYVSGNLNGQTDFQVYRPSTPLVDPVTKKLLGFEYAYVGAVKLIKEGTTPNEAHTFLVTKAREELSIEDRLLAVPVAEMSNYVPHPPAGPIEGQVVSIYGGVSTGGQNQTVSINLGEKDGMDIGTVLQLYRSGIDVVDKLDNKRVVRLPDEEYGNLFIYRVFNNVSYGLIMGVSNTTRIGDTVRSPE
jgi:hypothetical protein